LAKGKLGNFAKFAAILGDVIDAPRTPKNSLPLGAVA
jgi:hypothetical protein